MEGKQKPALWFENVFKVQLKTYIFQSNLLKESLTYILLVLLKYLRAVLIDGSRKKMWKKWDERNNDYFLFYVVEFSISYAPTWDPDTFHIQR